jgi:hypothetical protein
MKNITNLDFIILDYEFYDFDRIPREIYCIVNNKKYLFKLDVAILDITEKENNE